MLRLAPSPAYALHPLWPERLGYRRALGLLRPALGRLIAATDRYTLMSPRNRTTLHREASRVLARGVPGDFVEIGVHRGGSAAVLASLLLDHPARRLHLFDRWGDLPETTKQDGAKQAEYRRGNIPEKLAALRDDDPLAATRQVLETVIGYPRAEYYQGWYEATLDTYRGGPIAFVSIDCDYYESVRLALAFVSRHASPGAVVVLDDYVGWPGVRTAVDEWKDAAGARIVGTGIGTAIARLP